MRKIVQTVYRENIGEPYCDFDNTSNDNNTAL